MSQSVAERRSETRIREVGKKLGYNEDTQQKAVELFEQASEEFRLSSRGSDSYAAAALIIAAKQNNYPTSIQEVVSRWIRLYDTDEAQDKSESGVFFRIPDSIERDSYEYMREAKKMAGRAQSAYTKELNVEVPPIDVSKTVSTFCQLLDLPDGIEDAANQMLKDILDTEPDLVTGKSPDILASAAIYFVIRLNDLRMDYTQETIADTTNVSAVSLRSRYQEFREHFGGEEKLRSEGRYQIPTPESDSDTGVGEEQSELDLPN